jgi:hypothetical protein
LLGTREKHAREIDARERGERKTTSPAWYRRETAKRERFWRDPHVYSFSSHMRRNKEENAFGLSFPKLPLPSTQLQCIYISHLHQQNNKQIKGKQIEKEGVQLASDHNEG